MKKMKFSMFTYLMITLLLVLSCSDWSISDKRTIIETIVIEPKSEIWIDEFEQVEEFDKIDIIWVLDRSCSMTRINETLLDSIETMMDALPEDVNWRLKMITAGTAWTTLQPDTFPLTRGDILSDAEQMLAALPGDQGEEGFDALKNYITLNDYARTWLRPSAAMLVVFVSDEEEQSDNSATVEDFTRWYENYRRTVFLASIVHLPQYESACDPPPASHNVGDRYIEATEYFEGQVVDICLDDWSLAVKEATNQMKPIEYYELTHKPYVETIIVYVDGQVSYDWYYDDVQNMIEFTVIPPSFAEVRMAYLVKEYL
jgi:hypothetical protein